MVVPTMLARIVDELEGDAGGGPDAALDRLRRRAACRRRCWNGRWRLFPAADFVNAYGLTETSSTIAVLGPDDHRAALGSDDPAAARG